MQWLASQKTFKILVNSSDVKTSSKSVELLTKIEGTQFIMALFCLESFLKQIEPFTVAIQAVKITLIDAQLLMKNLIKVMESNTLDSFTAVFDESKELARKMGVPILMNRNEIGSSKKEFWFNTILKPAQQSLIELLQAKLSEREHSCSLISKFHPNHVNQIDEKDIIEITKQYYRPLGFENSQNAKSALISELELYKLSINEMISNSSRYDMNLSVEQLIELTDGVFEKINTLLNVFAIVAVTNCSAERAFSLLRRTKTYLRSVMTEERLSNIAVIYSNRDKLPTPAEVLSVMMEDDMRIF